MKHYTLIQRNTSGQSIRIYEIDSSGSMGKYITEEVFRAPIDKGLLQGLLEGEFKYLSEDAALHIAHWMISYFEVTLRENRKLYV